MLHRLCRPPDQRVPFAKFRPPQRLVSAFSPARQFTQGIRKPALDLNTRKQPRARTRKRPIVNADTPGSLCKGVLITISLWSKGQCRCFSRM